LPWPNVVLEKKRIKNLSKWLRISSLVYFGNIGFLLEFIRSLDRAGTGPHKVWLKLQIAHFIMVMFRDILEYQKNGVKYEWKN
jgi:hypothetical protein